MPKMITNLDELIANLGPYERSAQPLEAMKKAGFTFGPEIKKAMEHHDAASRMDAATVARLDKELESYLPIRLKVGTPPMRSVSRVSVGGFRAVASLDLEKVNPVIAELFEWGTIPNSLSASDTAALIDIATLSQLCTNVPTASDASIGGLEVLEPPEIFASQLSRENVLVTTEVLLPILGSQPSAFRAALQIELPIGVLELGNTERGYRLGVSGQGAVAELIPDPSSEIQPQSAADLNQLNNIVSSAVPTVLGAFFVEGTLTLPAELTSKTFPNTKVKLVNAGAVTVGTEQNSFVIVGANTDSNQGTLNPLALTTFARPAAPFDFHGEIDDAIGTDTIMAVINSGDLAAYINGITSRHWWGHLLPAVNVNSGTVTFENGNITVSIGITVPHYCLGLDLDVVGVISGPPVISNGTMTIGAQGVDLSVNEGFWCAVTGIGALLGLVLEIIFIAKDAEGSDPLSTYPATYSFAPLPGTDVDWTLAIEQVSADNGTLTVDGTATLAPDPGYFIYLRIVTGNEVTGYTPLSDAQVTLMELDNPAPAGDDVVVPQTGTTIHTNAKFVSTDIRSYTPNSDQTLGTATTDNNGDVFFRVEPESATNPDGMNQIGGVFTETQTVVSLQSGKIVSSSTSTQLVKESKPDFGVAVTDSSGIVLTTRQLVVLNAATTHIGTAQNPLIVIVNRGVFL